MFYDGAAVLRKDKQYALHAVIFQLSESGRQNQGSPKMKVSLAEIRLKSEGNHHRLHEIMSLLLLYIFVE